MLFATDFDWERLATNFGAPFAILLILVYVSVKALAWAAKSIAEPLLQAHRAYLETTANSGVEASKELKEQTRVLRNIGSDLQRVCKADCHGDTQADRGPASGKETYRPRPKPSEG